MTTIKNTIGRRIYDFLKQFPPFNFMARGDLQDICDIAQVLYLDKDQVLFSRDEDYHAYFYIVHQGAVKLTRPSDNKEKTVDICDEGDLFGLRVTHEVSYRTTATANEETILYALPLNEFANLTRENTAVANFLIASFASNIKDPYSLEASGQLSLDYTPHRQQDIYTMSKANYTRKVAQINPSKTIKQAALLMNKHGIGCLVVGEENKPVGLFTHREMRDGIATGKLKSKSPVSEFMVSPVLCAQPDITVSEAQLMLLTHEINYLVITEDGTPDSTINGILSKHDIMVSYGNSPVELIKEIKRAPRTKNLRQAWEKATVLLARYLDQNLPLSQILKIFAQLKDAMMIRAMELSLRKMETAPPVAFAWLALGSQGRKEQLLYSDQDNALLYKDVSSHEAAATKAYFLKLANRMNKRLHKVGYDYCPADMMGSNPLYCLSLSEWKQQFTRWITVPSPESILLSSIFFDYQAIYGDTTLADDLTGHIISQLESGSILVPQLAKSSERNPAPMGFFRQFLVEPNGEHKDFFDIKSRAIAPLIDAARILCLGYKELSIKNTSDRYEKLAALDPPNKELYQNCAYAFKALLKFRTKRGLAQEDSGRFIKLEELSKADRLKLKRCFKPLRDVQEVVRIRYNTQNVVL